MSLLRRPGCKAEHFLFPLDIKPSPWTQNAKNERLRTLCLTVNINQAVVGRRQSQVTETQVGTCLVHLCFEKTTAILIIILLFPVNV